MKVRLISVTPDAEKLISYIARVSSPANQTNPDYVKLLRYCLKEGHFSVFEMADLTVEIECSRFISAQLLRHKSFSFSEFSQRYSKVHGFEVYEARRQDKKNRQNSIDDMSEENKNWFEDAQMKSIQVSNELYNEALNRGVAKELARALLPMSTQTRLYMKGSARSWIHFLQLRTGNGTQLETQEIAQAIQKIFIKEFPVISESLEWKS